MARPKKLPVVLTEDEQERLLQQPNPRYPTGKRNRTMLNLMLNTGLRLAEVTALKWRDLDLTTGKLMVRQGKGAKGSYIVGSGGRYRPLEKLARAPGGGVYEYVRAHLHHASRQALGSPLRAEDGGAVREEGRYRQKRLSAHVKAFVRHGSLPRDEQDSPGSEGAWTLRPVNDDDLYVHPRPGGGGGPKILSPSDGGSGIVGKQEPRRWVR